MNTRTAEDFRSADLIDSRDIIERVAELDARIDDDDNPLNEGETDELAELRGVIVDWCEVSDWSYGKTFIADDYFEDYARELADDIGAIDRDAIWPLTYIDWVAAADALKQDYTGYEGFGRTWWARA
jgi:hypothetical protein